MAFPIATLFLVLSGAAALTYQVTWVRLLSLSMGSTSGSVSTVLAAFFTGLAIGSYAASTIVRRWDNVRAYALLEAVIGVSGLVLLPVLLELDRGLALFPAVATATVTKFAAVIVLLAVPTICMGATFPVIAAIVVREEGRVGLRLGQIYSFNTAGAVLGAVLCGFVLIPRYGLDGAIYVAAAINLTIAASALAVARRRGVVLPEPGRVLAPTRATHPDRSLRTTALAVLGVTGMVSIAAEVGWTKYLAIFTGTTIYGFSAILAIYLTGIAVGSWLVRRRADEIRSPRVWLAWAMVGAGVALFLTRSGLSLAPRVAAAVQAIDSTSFLRPLLTYGYVLVVLLPPTVLFGIMFPLTLKLYCGDAAGVRARVGTAYAVNTLASILGSIAAGFWLIPAYGTDTLLVLLAAAMTLLSGLVVATAVGRGRRIAIAAGLVALVVLGQGLPPLGYEQLIDVADNVRDPLAGTRGAPRFLFLEEGKASVVSVVTYDGVSAALQSNGLTESHINMQDPRYGSLVESLLGLMPYFLHPEPRSAFVVGFGGGNTVSALTLAPELTAIDVVELEPAIVAAVRIATAGAAPALLDPRVRIEINDARNALLVGRERYDLIASQPSHPWVAGSGQLFTREFFAIVRSRLTEDGVFGQWVNLFNMDAGTLRSILRSFYESFPHGFSFAHTETGDLLLFGSAQPLVIDLDRIADRMKTDRLSRALGIHRIAAPSELLAFFALSRDEALAAAGEAPPSTDTNLLSEVRLAGPIGRRGGGDPYRLLSEHQSLDLVVYFAPDQAARGLFDLGRLHLERGSVRSANLAADRLVGVDEDLARRLEEEIGAVTGTASGAD